jgi:hypothetical protein
MANYTPANLVKAQLMLNGAFASQDVRFRDPAVWKLFVQGAETFIPDIAQLRTREDRAVEASYMKRSARTLGTGRTHNHTGSSGDSGVLTPSFTTYKDPFSITLKQADNSILTAQQMLDNEIVNVFANYMEGLDGLASDKLVASKTGVNVATNEGTFDATNDVYEITESTNGLRAMQIAKIVMDINKFQNIPLVAVCDSISYGKFLFQAAQGAQNATNTSFQFMGLTFIHDPSLTAKAATIDAGYVKGFWFLVPQGTVGALNWIPKQNRQGHEDTEGVYSSILNPFDGVQYAVHMYRERANGSSVNGYTQDVITQFEVSLDVALEVAPLSTSTASTIFAFAMV